jgi:hypothetical protein
VSHLLRIWLGVTCGCIDRRGTFFRDMAQSHGDLLQGKTCLPQTVTKVVSQIMKRDISDMVPLDMGGSLLHSAPPGMQTALGEPPGMISQMLCGRVLSLRSVGRAGGFSFKSQSTGPIAGNPGCSLVCFSHALLASLTLLLLAHACQFLFSSQFFALILTLHRDR